MSDEFLWVVDEEDHPIGSEERRRVHSSTLWHRGVHAFIWNEKKELLIQLRSKNKDKYPGHWDCSLSEHVNYKESYRDALLRGLKEELGISLNMLSNAREVVHFRMVYGSRDYMVCKLYFIHLNRGVERNIKLDKEEVEQIRWATRNELEVLLKKHKITPWFREMLKYVLGRRHALTLL